MVYNISIRILDVFDLVGVDALEDAIREHGLLLAVDVDELLRTIRESNNMRHDGVTLSPWSHLGSGSRFVGSGSGRSMMGNII